MTKRPPPTPDAENATDPPSVLSPKEIAALIGRGDATAEGQPPTMTPLEILSLIADPDLPADADGTRPSQAARLMRATGLTMAEIDALLGRDGKAPPPAPAKTPDVPALADRSGSNLPTSSVLSPEEIAALLGHPEDDDAPAAPT